MSEVRALTGIDGTTPMAPEVLKVLAEFKQGNIKNIKDAQPFFEYFYDEFYDIDAHDPQFDRLKINLNKIM